MTELHSMKVANECLIAHIECFEDQQKSRTFISLSCHDKFSKCQEKSFCLKLQLLYERELNKRASVERILNATI